MSECSHCETFARKGDSREDLLVESEPTKYWEHVDAKEAFIADFYRSWDIVAFPAMDVWHVRVYYINMHRGNNREIYHEMCSSCLKVLIGRAWALAHYN